LRIGYRLSNQRSAAALERLALSARGNKRIVRLLAIIIFAGVSLRVAGPFIWWRSPGYEVACDGKPEAKAKVYRHGDERLLDLADGSMWYLIRIDQKMVGSPNPDFMPTFLLAFAKEDPVPVVDLRSGKFDIGDPKLTIEDGTITFLDARGRTIRLTW
jgi:hypothetical protein